MRASKIITASTAAAAALPAAGAQAADLLKAQPLAPMPVVAETPLFVSIEGGAAFSSFSKDSQLAGFSESKLGQSPKRDIGAFGSISVGRNIEATPYDWRVNAAATQFLANNIAGSYDSYTQIGSGNKAGFQTGDFEIGRTFNMDSVQVRVFGGVRALNEKSSSSASFDYGFGYFGADINLSQRFLGFGPRIGAEVRVGGALGLVGSVSAAYLYGRNQNTTSVGYSIIGYDFNISQASSSMDWVTDVTASLAASYKPSEKTEIIAGYRGEKLFNINSAQQKDMTNHGPFVKVNTKF